MTDSAFPNLLAIFSPTKAYIEATYEIKNR